MGLLLKYELGLLIKRELENEQGERSNPRVDAFFESDQ